MNNLSIIKIVLLVLSISTLIVGTWKENFTTLCVGVFFSSLVLLFEIVQLFKENK